MHVLDDVLDCATFEQNQFIKRRVLHEPSRGKAYDVGRSREHLLMYMIGLPITAQLAQVWLHADFVYAAFRMCKSK